VTTVSESADTGRRFELRGININFPVGELTVITGPTASGKTALLMALMGEMTAVFDGQPTVANIPSEDGPKIFLPKRPSQYDVTTGLKNHVSYAAQAPWLEHLTIKDNILFGSPYEEERYNEVIWCCALQPDLDMLEDGDQTEIGVRGVSLSGGQKARVALARAVYTRTKHVLLDDPLSAVVCRLDHQSFQFSGAESLAG
jgi:ABC-type transport system involved in cytochrome bd biosynthesis fused ATPase/permease subunit